MFLRWGIPRRMIIPLRTFLSTVLFAISCLFINYGDLPSIFTTILLIGWAATSFLCPFLIIVLLYAIILRDQKNWAEWWQNIVYASIFTILFWMFTRDGFDFTGSGGIRILFLGPYILLFVTIVCHFIMLYQSAKRKKHFKPVRYCLLTYFVLTCLFFTFGGYRNFDRNYTMEESQKAEAFLWEYDVCRMSNHIPQPLELNVKTAYAEKYFLWFRYDNDFSNKRVPHFIGNSYRINILFDKSFIDHDYYTYNNPFICFFEPDHNMYQLKWKDQDTIPPPDTLTFCFKYSLTPEGQIVTDTLRLTRR